jgi:hypothetical protein
MRERCGGRSASQLEPSQRSLIVSDLDDNLICFAAAIAQHERFGERMQAFRSGHRKRPAPD